MVSVTTGRTGRPTECVEQSSESSNPSESSKSSDSSDSSKSPESPELSKLSKLSKSPSVDREAAVQALAAHAGEVVTEERQQALRAFDDEVSPAVRRVLSTLAVRVAVGAMAPAATAIAEGDAQTAATVSTLFSPDE